MLILSRCQALIGTYQSSFSEVAWWLGGTQQAVTIPTPPIVQQLLSNPPPIHPDQP